MQKRTQTPKATKKARAYSNTRETGRLVGIIAVRPKGLPKEAYNPLVISWTVNPYRKDFNDVVEQGRRKGRLSDYNNSLLNSMFKKWGSDDEQAGTP